MKDQFSRNQLLELSVVDESARFPELPTVLALFALDRSGRTTLLPGSHRHANEWHQGCMDGAGGPAPPPEWDQYHKVWSAPVTLYRELHAHYSPGTGAIIGNEGGVLSASIEEAKYVIQDLSGLPGVTKDGERMLLALPQLERRLQRAIVTMPWGALHNYGHFVLDCLPAAALLSTMRELAGHRFVFPPLKPWQRRHLQLLGIDPLECGEEWLSADEVVYSSCMNVFLHWPNVNYRTLVSLQMQQLGSSPKPAARLYIARRSSEKRLFVSEEAVQTRLAQAGFKVIYPEDLSVDAQVAFFCAADVVVGCTGAALANTIYCKPGAVVVEIQPSLARGIWVRNICAIMGLKWRPYFCEAQPPVTPNIIGGLERTDIGITFDVELDDFLSFLDTICVRAGLG